MCAALIGHKKILSMLLAAGAHIESASTEGCTPLIAAAQHGHCDAIKLLLEHQSNLEHVDAFGFTPLLIAASHCEAQAMRLLIEAGADPNRTWEPTSKVKDGWLLQTLRGGNALTLSMCGKNNDAVCEYAIRFKPTPTLRHGAPVCCF